MGLRLDFGIQGAGGFGQRLGHRLGGNIVQQTGQPRVKCGVRIGGFGGIAQYRAPSHGK